VYVCLCNAVTDGQIRSAMGEGVTTLRDLRQRLGVAGRCGRCARCALALLLQARENGRPGSGTEAA
jgi:bacterioferritin-associated ferredoxin